MIPGQWFYITAPCRHDHVLSVVNVSFEPQARVELRPNQQGAHQLWYMDPHGYIINKLSGCVLAVKAMPKNRTIQGQNVIQARRQNLKDAKAQLWEYLPVDKDDSDEHGSNSYYLRLKAFDDLYLMDKDVPTFGENKIKWHVVYD